jgi:hypothetical protein
MHTAVDRPQAALSRPQQERPSPAGDLRADQPVHRAPPSVARSTGVVRRRFAQKPRRPPDPTAKPRPVPSHSPAHLNLDASIPLRPDIASKFLAAVLSQDKVKRLLSSENFSVDGTLLEARASAKSFRMKDGSSEPPGEGRNGERDFHRELRRNDTHASTSDSDARLYRKGPGKEAKLFFMAMR